MSGIGDASSARRWLVEKLDEAYAGLPPGRSPRVVDLGCGDGVASAVAAERLRACRSGARLIGLDRDLAALLAARNAADLRPLAADYYALPLTGDSVDLGIALNVFHGVDRRRFSVELRRILRPHGRLLAYERLPQVFPVRRLALLLDRGQLESLERLPERRSAVTRGAAQPSG